MKVLTIKEPWSTLIIEGYKKYEFRSWKTKYRGKILIHAGLTFENNMKDRFKEYNLNYNCAHIIGEAEITESKRKIKDLKYNLNGTENDSSLILSGVYLNNNIKKISNGISITRNRKTASLWYE